jgi:hypothetical protein
MSSGPNRVVAGLLAGASGMAAIDGVTWLDMLARGRPPNDVPERSVAMLLRKVGIDIVDDRRPATEHRKMALGALAGYGVGLGLGALYGIVAGPRRPRVRAAGAALGVAALLSTDVPLLLQGLMRPADGGSVNFMAADLVPHLTYGLATAAAYRVIQAAEVPSRWGRAQ